MSGLDEILDIIAAQQKETESNIMSSADKRVSEINEDARLRADKAYSDYMQRAKVKNELDFENSCSSVDASVKRRLLEYKVSRIDEAVELTLKKLRSLPEEEYFELLTKLISNKLRSGKGEISLSAGDLKRLPSDFKSIISEAAAKQGGTVELFEEPADITDGFILSYGNISENCSFEAMIEAERDWIRDTAAKALFGQVSK